MACVVVPLRWRNWMPLSRRQFSAEAVFFIDSVVVALGTWLLDPITPTYAWLIPFTVGHFFLFCNVVRMRRPQELIWAALFLVNFAALAFLFPPFAWPRMVALQLPVTLALTWLTVRSPQYRGAFSSVRLTDS